MLLKTATWLYHLDAPLTTNPITTCKDVWSNLTVVKASNMAILVSTFAKSVCSRNNAMERRRYCSNALCTIYLTHKVQILTDIPSSRNYSECSLASPSNTWNQMHWKGTLLWKLASLSTPRRCSWLTLYWARQRMTYLVMLLYTLWEQVSNSRSESIGRGMRFTCPI